MLKACVGIARKERALSQAHVPYHITKFVLSVCALLSPLFALSVHGQESSPVPDFYLLLDQCKTTVGYLVPSNKSMVQMESKPVNFACLRKSQYVNCDLMFADGESASIQFEVKLDIPPHLYLANSNFNDFVVVNSAAHSAVLVTRLLEVEYAGSKVCHGKFTTRYEFDRLRELQR